MKLNLKSILVIVALFALVIVIYAQSPRREVGPDLSRFPIADYKTAKENKRAKGKKYNDKHGWEVTENSNGTFLITDWDSNLPALPVAESSAIVVGRVLTSEAQLSEDNTNIYSEFTVKVSDVLKNGNAQTNPGETIVIERWGGRIRMPSGKIVVAVIDHQEMPQKNKDYIFFLTDRLNGVKVDDGLYILTAYELRNDKVFPMAAVRKSHSMRAYTGKGASVFFDDLNRLLAESVFSQSK